MWLGHKNQIDKINVRSVPLRSSTASIVDNARDLGVVIDSQLTTNQVTARYAGPVIISFVSCVRWLDHCVRGICQNSRPGVHIQPSGLL